MVRKFIRRDSIRYSKLGKNRKKLQKWRRPKGRDNKMRERHAGYPKRPNVGYKTSKKDSGKIDGKEIFVVYNVNELETAEKNSVIIIGRVGARKKLDLIGKATTMGLKILNLAKQNVGGKKNAVK